MKKKTTRKTVKNVGETLVNFILDNSSSMESVRTSTISGFNEYITTLKNDGNKYSFSLVCFDTNLDKKYINEPIEKVKNLDVESYRPDGSTALYDAVCTTIKDINEKKGQKVITIIMTDGEENSSKEYTQVQMKTLIEEREKKGNWTFVYLGANQDSYAIAQKYGIQHGNTVNFSASSTGMTRTMNVMASNTSNFASMRTSNTSAFFSQADQKNMTDEDATIKNHFSNLGKKSWEKRKKDLLS